MMLPALNLDAHSIKGAGTFRPLGERLAVATSERQFTPHRDRHPDAAADARDLSQRGLSLVGRLRSSRSPVRWRPSSSCARDGGGGSSVTRIAMTPR